MKFNKSILFLSTVVCMSLPLSLSAVTFEELAEKILTARSCLARIELLAEAYEKNEATSFEDTFFEASYLPF